MNAVMNFRSTKDTEFLDLLGDYQFVKVSSMKSVTYQSCVHKLLDDYSLYYSLTMW